MFADLKDQIKAVRRVSAPIIAINTSDPASTRAEVTDVINGENAVLGWDVVKGLFPLNEAGGDAFTALTQEIEPEALMGPPGLVALLSESGKLPEDSALFVHNAHRLIDEGGIAQAIWNVRDTFKAAGSTLILLSPGITVPAELEQDILVFDEPLPDRGQLEGIVTGLYKDAELAEPAADEVERSVDALQGLGAFPAEQATAMSLTKDGMDVEALWERKRQMIEATPGLSVWRGDESFDAIGGSDNVKSFLGRVATGNNPPKAIVFIDEIEKAMAGSDQTAGASDNTGVSQDFHKELLRYMQDEGASGMIFVGPPGSGKSVVAKAAGRLAGVPTVSLDLGGMKTSALGASEANIRRALKVVSAVSGGNALFIATCNSFANLSLELRRRFTFGTFFFDLPNRDERLSIWSIYSDGVPNESDRPDDDGWTGAEIRQCAMLARDLGSSLKDAAEYIVPIARSAPETVETLRTQASGRFISASAPGTYQKPAVVTQGPKGRKFRY